jgi:hypothetical protein
MIGAEGLDVESAIMRTYQQITAAKKVGGVIQMIMDLDMALTVCCPEILTPAVCGRSVHNEKHYQKM